jgi:hypothetical protein
MTLLADMKIERIIPWVLTIIFGLLLLNQDEVVKTVVKTDTLVVTKRDTVWITKTLKGKLQIDTVYVKNDSVSTWITNKRFSRFFLQVESDINGELLDQRFHVQMEQPEITKTNTVTINRYITKTVRQPFYGLGVDVYVLPEPNIGLNAMFQHGKTMISAGYAIDGTARVGITLRPR